MRADLVERAMNATVRLRVRRPGAHTWTDWATGFFYIDMEIVGRPTEGPPTWGGDTKHLWLVTNKHVVVDRTSDQVMDVGVLLRDPDYQGMLAPTPPTELILNQDYLLDHTWIPNQAGDEPDIAAIDLDPDAEPELRRLLEWVFEDRVIGEGIIIGREQRSQKMRVLTREDCVSPAVGHTQQVGRQVLIIGYPAGGVDRISEHPIAKSGTIATDLIGFEHNTSLFLVDVNQFVGSSGSPIISYPFVLAGSQGLVSIPARLIGVHSGTRRAERPDDIEIDAASHCEGCQCFGGSAGLGLGWSMPWAFFDATDQELEPLRLRERPQATPT